VVKADIDESEGVTTGITGCGRLTIIGKSGDESHSGACDCDREVSVPRKHVGFDDIDQMFEAVPPSLPGISRIRKEFVIGKVYRVITFWCGFVRIEADGNRRQLIFYSCRGRPAAPRAPGSYPAPELRICFLIRRTRNR